MNDERPIENLLRRAALERAVGAGDPLELQPAKRAELQAEVAKQFPPAPSPAAPIATPAPALVDWWALIKQRWVYGVAAFAALWIIALVVAPMFSKPKTDSLAASSRFDQSAPVAIANEVPLTNLQPADMLAAEAAIVDHAEVGAMAKVSPPRSVMTPAAKPSGTKTPAEPKTTKQKSAGLSPAAKNAPATTESIAAPADFAASTKVEGAVVGTDTAAVLEAERQLVATVAKENPAAAPPRIRSSQQFSNTTAATRSRDADRFPFEQPIQPLRKQFRIEQSGRDLRVIDSDGSVYRGFVDEYKTVYTEMVQRKGAALSNSFDQKFKLSSAKATAAQSTAPRDTTYYRYRAEGTNRTLNQLVVFSWNFIPTNEAAANRLNLQRPILGSSVTETQFPALLQSSRLNGVIRYGVSGAASIDAQPAK